MSHPEPSGHGTRVGLNFLKLGAGEAAARIIAFGATVYLARTLGASTYGVIALATAVLLYLSVLSDAGIDALGIRDIAADREGLFGVLPDVLGARLLIAAGLILLTTVAGLTLMPQPEGMVLAVYALTLGTVGLGTRWVHLGLEQPGQVALARVLSEGVSAVLIVFLVRAPDHLVRVPLAQLVGESLGALLLLRLLPAGAMRLRVHLRPALVGGLLSRSWPMVLHAILGLAIFNSDLIFLRVLRDSAAVGFYAAAYTLISFFLNLGATYTMSLIPALTRLRHEPLRAREVYDASMAQVMAGVIPVCIGGIMVAGPVVDLIFGDGYSASVSPLQILLFLLPAAFIRNVSQAALLAHGRQHQLLTTVAVAAGVNFLLNLALIPRWGTAGAAWATVATETMRCGLVLVYAHRLGLPMPPPGRFVRSLGAGGVMALSVLLARETPVPVTVAIGAAVYVGVLAALGGIRFRRGSLPELTV